MLEIKFDAIFQPTDIQLHVNKTEQNTLIEIATQDEQHVGILLAGDNLILLKGLIEKTLTDNPDIATWGEQTTSH